MAELSAGTEANPSDIRQTPAPLEPGDYAHFTLHAKNEILFVMRNLLDSAAQVTLSFNEGRGLLLTTLLAVEDDGVLLDFGASPESNLKALTVDKLFCVASHEKVRIQFLLRNLAQVSFEDRPAFRAALPSDVLRLQRREFFRLATPVVRPLKCLIPHADVEGDMRFMNANVGDISGGGIGLTVPDGIALEVGTELQDCRIDLPEVGAMTAKLKVRNQFEVTLPNGGRTKRAGCEFVKLSGPMLALIQRYIIKVERERKARERGLL